MMTDQDEFKKIVRLTDDNAKLIQELITLSWNAAIETAAKLADDN